MQLVKKACLSTYVRNAYFAKNKAKPSMFTLNCKGRLMVIAQPTVMAIINVTPDSFYAGSRKTDVAAIVETAGKMIDEGASILDIGGQSTRPGSSVISAAEELDRVLPSLESIKAAFPTIFVSIDTFYATVAAEAVATGADLINDISAGNLDENMLSVVAKMKVPYICMHMQHTPQTMQHNPQYGNVVLEVLDFLIEKVNACKAAGIADVIIDPGFGFGKTINHNFQLLKGLSYFKLLNLPILAGLSRKGTIYKTLGTSAEEALNGTTVMNTIALMNGANILRVHDVKEAAEAIKLHKAYSAVGQ